MTPPCHPPMACSWHLVAPRPDRSGAERLFGSSWSAREELQGCKAHGAELLLLGSFIGAAALNQLLQAGKFPIPGLFKSLWSSRLPVLNIIPIPQVTLCSSAGLAGGDTSLGCPHPAAALSPVAWAALDFWGVGSVLGCPRG